jgi:hypothetical protein
MLDTGLAQVYVYVDEARRHNEPGSIVHLSAGEIEIGAQRGDAPIFQRQVGYRVESRGRVDHAPILN